MKTEYSDSRRNFINALSLAAGSLLAPSVISEIFPEEKKFILEDYDPTVDHTENEMYWKKVRSAFELDKVVINLNNGGVSPAPTAVVEAMNRYALLTNKIPSYNLYRVIDQGRAPLKIKLAELAGCSPDELAINRNATEALETIIFGLELNPGDEIVLSKQDYPSMQHAWQQRAKRDGVVLKWVDLNLPSEDTEYLVEEYKKAFSDKTKIVHITHLINWNGQLLPAKEIAAEAKKIGAEVILDAAHSFAQIPFKFSELEVDYAGISLHKWLCAPIGTGLLYVSKDKIKDLYPLFSPPENEDGDIKKFEHLGTRSFAIEQAIGDAIDFHFEIGTETKSKRLYFLKNYWTKKLSKIKGVTILTPRSRTFSGSIGLFQLEGHDLPTLLNKLYRTYNIHVTMIDHGNLKGIRISPNIYTLKKDLDKLVDAIKELSKA